MALHVVLGFSLSGPKSPCEPIYCGDDADAAKVAIAAYDGHRTTWLRNPVGVTKLTSRIAADRSEAQDAREHARFLSSPGRQVSAEEQLANAQREIANLKRQIKNDRPAEVPVNVIEAPAAPAAAPELALESETLPMVNSSEPAAGESAAPVAGDEETTSSEIEDPDAAARRQAAEAMAASAEQIEATPPKTGKRGK